MHKLTITLKQHTPLIHFQHDQDGATLRASEVKPKLDKYILTRLGDDNYDSLPDDDLQEVADIYYSKNEKKSFDDLSLQQQFYEVGKYVAKKIGWFVGKGEHPALDYKMRIEAEGKQYKHTITIINAKKVAAFSERTVLTIFCLNSSILEYIKKHLAYFFVLYNFGFRQSKGYGSFTIDGVESNYIQILEKQGWYSTNELPIISTDTRIKYTLKLIRVKLYDKDKNNKLVKTAINKYKVISVNTKKGFDAHFCLEDHRSEIIEEINKKLKEIQKRADDCIRPYVKDIVEGLKKSIREIESVHNDFLYNYFEKLLDDTISSAFQSYKSGKNHSYEKSHLRDFFGVMQGNTDIVYWEKRFMKQKINQLNKENEELKNLNLVLKDEHRNRGSELCVDDEKEQKYFFIRALIGLEGNFEFQTNDKNKKFVVTVNGDEVERFQSVIMFKAIDNEVYVCIKPQRELKKILNKGFSFALNVKDKEGRTYLKKPIDMGIVNTPCMNDQEIGELYQDIKTFFNKVVSVR